MVKFEFFYAKFRKTFYKEDYSLPLELFPFRILSFLFNVIL